MIAKNFSPPGSAGRGFLCFRDGAAEKRDHTNGGDNSGAHKIVAPPLLSGSAKGLCNQRQPAAMSQRQRSQLMDARPTPVTARYLRTPDAAVHLGLSARTLEKHRCYGTGPVYHKLGGRIVYRISDLDAWAELGLRRSTSDPGKGVVHPAKRIDGYTGPVRR